MEQLTEEMFWVETPSVNQSAFVRYSNALINQFDGGAKTNSMNMNKRMMEFLKRNGNANIAKRERDYKHMISERARRENQKQSYLALHCMLPFGTKNDKKSITQTAAAEIQELEKCKKELQRRNEMIQTKLAVAKKGEDDKIRLRISNPSSGIDSMIEVVKCLKELGLKTTSLHSQFSNVEFSAQIEISQTQIGAENIEKSAQRRLDEAERKRAFFFPGRGGGGR